MLIPVVLSGPPAHLMGSAAVERLQQALTALAQVRKRPQINPGPITGEMNDTTMMALNAALGILAEELPSWLYLALQGAFIAGGTSATAKQYATQYAPQLTIAINTATTKYKMAHPASDIVVADPIAIVSPWDGWYKKPWGIGLIALGALITYKLVFAAPKKAAA